MQRSGAFQRTGGFGRGTLLPMSALLQRLDHFARHVSLVMLGKDGRGIKDSARFQLSFGDDTLPFAEQIGEDPVIEDGDVGLVMRKAMRLPAPRWTLRSSTRPPIRTLRSGEIAWVFRSLGLKKKTMLALNAVSTSAVAPASAAMPTATKPSRCCLRVIAVTRAGAAAC